jgi:uncharacterized protein (TIGR03437 family)
MLYLWSYRPAHLVYAFCLGAWLLATPVYAQLNAKLLGQLDPFTGHNRYGDVWGEGRYAYLASYNCSGVMIIDIANPRAPVLAGVFEPEGGARFQDVVVIEGIAYCSSEDNKGVYIADVRDPQQPKVLSQITPAQSGFPFVHELFVADGLLFEADSRRPSDGRPPRVKVFDVTNPAQPVFIRDVFTTDTLFIHNMFALNGRLYTSGWSGRTDIFDIRNLRTQEPPLLGTVQSGNSSHSSWVSNDGKLLVSCRETLDGDVRLFDITDPANPRQLAVLTAQSLGLTAYTAHNPVIVGNLLFVAWYQAGTVVFDISDPSKPEMVANYDTFPDPVACPSNCYGGNWGIYPLLGLDRVLLSDLDGGLLIVDFSVAGKGPKTVSAASYTPGAITPKTIVAGFGSNLATGSRTASFLPLPTSLAGVSVTVQDYAGVERAAPLFFVSPNQINYQIPANSKPGPALVKFTNSTGQTTLGATTIVATAPALFTTNQSGSGAAVALDAFNFTPAPFAAVRPNGAANVVMLFGTGLGNDATETLADVSSSVRATVDGKPVEIVFAGSVPGLVGLNHINLVLPAGLSAGEHRLQIFRSGMGSNEVTIATR